jgi:hypothetical protein
MGVLLSREDSKGGFGGQRGLWAGKHTFGETIAQRSRRGICESMPMSEGSRASESASSEVAAGGIWDGWVEVVG